PQPARQQGLRRALLVAPGPAAPGHTLRDEGPLPGGLRAHRGEPILLRRLRSLRGLRPALRRRPAEPAYHRPRREVPRAAVRHHQHLALPPRMAAAAHERLRRPQDEVPVTDARLAREIEFHRRIASRAEAVWNWDSPAGRRRARRRADLFVEKGELAPGRRVLELGCGTGIFLEMVARCGASIAAVDLSADLLARARERVKDLPNVRLTRGNAMDMPYPADAFDAVYGSSILHHLDLERALGEVHRVLRPGGRIVFAEPNILNPQVV